MCVEVKRLPPSVFFVPGDFVPYKTARKCGRRGTRKEGFTESTCFGRSESGCSGERTLGDESYYGLGMDALVIGCARA